MLADEVLEHAESEFSVKSTERIEWNLRWEFSRIPKLGIPSVAGINGDVL